MTQETDPFEDDTNPPDSDPETADGSDGDDPFSPGASIHGGTADDIDTSFATSILLGGREMLREAIGRGITSERLQGNGRKVYQFAIEYLGAHGQAPTIDLVAAKLGIVLPDQVSGTPSFWISEVIGRHLHSSLQQGLHRWASSLERRQAMEAFADIQTWVREEASAHSPVTIAPLFSHAEAVKDRYNRRMNGEMGILTPWPTLNALTMGMEPEDVWLYVARSGIGKTWLTVLIAYTAWVAGYRVLFATTEMSQVSITQRFLAIHFRFPYDLFTRGKLPIHMQERFFKEYNQFATDERISLVGGDFDFEPSTYEAAIERHKPHLTVLDGAYLLKTKGKSRHEAAADAFNEIKRIGKRQKTAQVITSQFNREQKADEAKGAAQEKVALSDAAVWNASGIGALTQTPDMRRDRIAWLKLLKNREGPLGEIIPLRWDFGTMDFSEIEPDHDTQGDDFGSGVEGSSPSSGADDIF